MPSHQHDDEAEVRLECNSARETSLRVKLDYSHLSLVSRLAEQ